MRLIPALILGIIYMLTSDGVINGLFFVVIVAGLLGLFFELAAIRREEQDDRASHARRDYYICETCDREQPSRKLMLQHGLLVCDDCATGSPSTVISEESQ